MLECNPLSVYGRERECVCVFAGACILCIYVYVYVHAVEVLKEWQERI